MGSHFHEIRKGDLGAEEGNGGAILGAETAEEVQYLACLADRLPDVVEGVRELLEAAAIRADGHVTLLEGAELCLEVDDAGHGLVVEETNRALPDLVRRGFSGREDHHVHDNHGHGGVQPIDNGLIDHDPLRIKQEARMNFRDMTRRANLPKMDSKK